MNHFLKVSNITVKNMRSNIAHNLIMVLFVIIAVFFMNVSLASFRYSDYLYKFAKTSGLYDSFMYAGQTNKQAYFADNSGEDLSGKAMGHAEGELRQMKADGIIEDYSKAMRSGNFAGENTDMQVDFLYMKPELLEELSIPVAEGDWFDACPPEYRKEGLVPVVIGNHLKSIYQTGDVFTDASSDTRYVVTGILERGARFLDMSASGSGMDLNSLFSPADDMVIAAEEPKGQFWSFIIRLPERGRADSEQIVMEKIADVTDTFSFHYLTDRAHEDSSYGIQMQTTLAVLALLICIAGIACGNLLAFARGKKRQAVYFLCGMRPETGTACAVLENLLKLFLPAIAGLYVFFGYCRKQEYYDLYPGIYNVWITGLVLAVLFAASVMHQASIVRKNKELSIIRS